MTYPNPTEQLGAQIGETTLIHPHMRVTTLPEGLHSDWDQKMFESGLLLMPSSGEPTAVNVKPMLLELSDEAQAELEARANAVADALEVGVRALSEDPQYFREAGIIPDPYAPLGYMNEAEAQELMLADRPSADPSLMFGRIDMFPVEKEGGGITFQAIEANMRCVEGGAFSSIVQHNAAATFGLETDSMPATAAEAMVFVARQGHASRRAEQGLNYTEPRIGFVYWTNDPVKSVETPRIKDHVTKRDPEAQISIGRPDHMRVAANDNGKLDVYLPDGEIEGGWAKLDVVYRNIGLHDFTWRIDDGVATADVLKDMLLNPDDYNAVVVPSSHQGWAGYKSMFALISDPKYTEVFTSAGMDAKTLELARETVGWSRMLHDVEPDGPDTQRVLTQPDQYVLKHIAGAGGANVVLGWSPDSLLKARDMLGCNFEDKLVATNPQAAWSIIVDSARKQGGYLIQKRINYMEMPGGLVMDVNPYIVAGAFQGQVVSRIGYSHPINVKQGGGLVPIAWRGSNGR